MSPIGRILIVVNLLLAAAFLGWAAQTLKVSQDFKTQLQELETSSSSEIDGLNDQIASLNSDLAAIRQRADAEAARAENLETRNQGLTTDLNEARSDNDALREELSGYNSRLDDLSRSVDAATERAAQEASDARDAIAAQEAAEDAQREAEIAQRDAEDRARQLEARVSDLAAANGNLSEELSTANDRLDAVAALTGVDMTKVLDAPALDVDVIAVDMNLEPGFVSISAGSTDGVRRGMVFQIYRGATYKGEVRVESVSEGACAAVVTTSVAGTEIMRGDKATTAL